MAGAAAGVAAASLVAAAAFSAAAGFSAAATVGVCDNHIADVNAAVNKSIKKIFTKWTSRRLFFIVPQQGTAMISAGAEEVEETKRRVRRPLKAGSV
ncbi:MAG: hypothetical protein LAP21_05870 [Acidobacteriia bacterium]|nr:hypothetical protein [Terriglobia bacterium]